MGGGGTMDDGSGGGGGGSPCRMSILRNGNVTLSNLRNPHVAMSVSSPLSLYFSIPCRMSLRPRISERAISPCRF